MSVLKPKLKKLEDAGSFKKEIKDLKKERKRLQGQLAKAKESGRPVKDAGANKLDLSVREELAEALNLAEEMWGFFLLVGGAGHSQRAPRPACRESRDHMA